MKDYFVYLPKQPANSTWGCVTTAAGFTNIPQNKPYPVMPKNSGDLGKW
jgi:hypothetical protein